MGGKPDHCCEPAEASCRVESVLSVDERGQMVLPKDLRNRAGIVPGDRMAVISHEAGGEICCITLMKVESLDEPVRSLLRPVMKDIVYGQEK